MDMTRCSLGKFLVVPTFVTRRLHICKAARDSSGERWNYLFRRLSCNLHKWPLSRHLLICFWISEPVFVQTIVFRVWVLDLQPISEMYALGSWLGQSDEIRLYANNMQRIYTEYATKSRIETNEATGINSFDFISYMCWIWVRSIWRYRWWNTFNGILSKSRLYRR